MLEKLRQIENRYAELESKLADPAYYSDPAVFTKLCREQRELQPVVEAYRAYTACQAQIAQAEALLGDPELHEIARDEIEHGKIRCADLEQQLRVLLLPRDPNDDRNVILEIRTGVGGEESALFAHTLYRMEDRDREPQRDGARWRARGESAHQRAGGLLPPEV